MQDAALTSSLGHEPAGPWAFDESVTACFDDMLRRSIPQYEEMRRLVYDLGCRYVEPGHAIVDVGCSRGEALWPFVQRFGNAQRYVGVECSAPMAAAARERFAREIGKGWVEVREEDLRRYYPTDRACLTLAVLTLQFVPIDYRSRIVRAAYRATAPGGALIVVEKVLGDSADIDGRLVDLYADHKRSAGYSQGEIDRKRFSLEGVLVPVTARWNEDLLRSAGFAQVDCFWRWLNFAGWVAVKE